MLIIIDIVIVFVIYGVWLYTKVVYAKHPCISPVGGIQSELSLVSEGGQTIDYYVSTTCTHCI